MDQNDIKEQYFNSFCNYKIYLIDGAGFYEDRKSNVEVMKKNASIWDEEYRQIKASELLNSSNFNTFFNICIEYTLSFKDYSDVIKFNDLISSIIIKKYHYAKYFNYYYKTFYIDDIYLDFNKKNNNLISYICTSRNDSTNLLKKILKIISLDNYKYSLREREKIIKLILTKKNHLINNKVNDIQYNLSFIKKIKKIYFNNKANFNLLASNIKKNHNLYFEIIKNNISLFDIEYRYKQLICIKSDHNFLKFQKCYNNYLASVKEIDELFKLEQILYNIISSKNKKLDFFNLYYNLILLNTNILSEFKDEHNTLINYLFNTNKLSYNKLLAHISYVLKLDTNNTVLKQEVARLKISDLELLQML